MDSPLRALGHRVLMSPHSAAFNEGGELRPGIQWAARSVLTALAGGIPDNVYNRDVIPKWKERFGGARVRTGSYAAGATQRRPTPRAPDPASTGGVGSCLIARQKQ